MLAAVVVGLDRLRHRLLGVDDGGKGLIRVLFAFVDAIDAVGDGALKAVVGDAHAEQQPRRGERPQEVVAAVLGGFNRSSQHRVVRQTLDGRSAPLPASSILTLGASGC